MYRIFFMLTTRFSASLIAIDNSYGTAHAYFYSDGAEGAIESTAATFNTAILVNDLRFAIFHGKDPMRAYLYAKAAALAFILIQFEGNNITNIFMLHHSLLITACQQWLTASPKQ
jgi:hypothetical protein